MCSSFPSKEHIAEGDFDQRPCQQGQIPGGAVMLLVGQPGSVTELGVVHVEQLRLLIHQIRKLIFVASNMFSLGRRWRRCQTG